MTLALIAAGRFHVELGERYPLERAGEAQQASKTSTEDISSGRRGGLRSHKGPGGRTRDQLYEEAKRKDIKGRSKMNKDELRRAVDAA